jgi:tyrosinase
VQRALAATSFVQFDVRVQGDSLSAINYHGGGHLGVGSELGEVADIYSSPGDPIFYLHHANMDRLWDKWQRLNFASRKTDIGGPDTQFAYPWEFFGPKPYQNVTLNYDMQFGALFAGRATVKIRDSMDSKGGPLCYTYA